MRTAMIVLLSLALAGCQPQTPPSTPEPAAYRELPDIEAIVQNAMRGAQDPEEATRRMAEALYWTCDQEFGAQFRNEAIRRSDEMVTQGEVPQPQTVRDGYLLMRRAYAEVAEDEARRAFFLEPAPWLSEEEIRLYQQFNEQSEARALRSQIEDLNRNLQAAPQINPINPNLGGFDGGAFLRDSEQQRHIWQEDYDRIRRQNQEVLRRSGNPYAQ